MKNKKIGLITIHRANNYGAFLQAFATQESLKKYGDVEVIDYRNEKLESSFHLIRFNITSIKSGLGAVKDLLRIIPRWRVIRKFKLDIVNKFNLTPRLNSSEVDNYANEKFDVLVSGSDQIWNPVCVSSNENLDTNYLLNFGRNDSKRISYASSMGAFEIDTKNINTLKKSLTSYDHISVREIERKTEIQELVGKDVTHVLDPTLLLSRDEWLSRFPEETKRVKQISNNKYILFYSVPKVKKTRIVVEYFSKLTGLDVVSIDQDIYPYYRAKTKIRDASVGEFLHLFKNAEFIITDSFHGVCFSLIFRKNFFAVSPGKLSNRIVSLLDVVGLSDRLIYGKENINSHSDFSIDYVANNVSDKIESERVKSKEFLDLSLR
ncbi:polysaccharide pyruvyl transferase family protein [Photobacterium sp. 53610]|uniref:polysaccharide pyruvyl transferase family protein n=1 Tax=Photobacterium sp. 53610 TaxID=3102789 RepID=UPI002EDB07C1